jgi:hypothetical protein
MVRVGGYDGRWAGDSMACIGVCLNIRGGLLSLELAGSERLHLSQEYSIYRDATVDWIDQTVLMSFSVPYLPERYESRPRKHSCQ